MGRTAWGARSGRAGNLLSGCDAGTVGPSLARAASNHCRAKVPTAGSLSPWDRLRAAAPRWRGIAAARVALKVPVSLSARS